MRKIILDTGSFRDSEIYCNIFFRYKLSVGGESIKYIVM